MAADRHPGRGPVRAAAAVLPGLAGLALLATLAVRLPAFLLRAVPSSDTISSVLLAQAVAGEGHGPIYLGNHPGYNDLLLSGLALHLPAFHLSSQAVTYAVYVLGVALLAWTVRRRAGWWAAGISALFALTATPLLLVNETSPTGRVPTLANIVLLGWLIGALTGDRRRSVPWVVAASVAVGVVTGLDAASDPLLVATGVLPFAAAATLLGLRYRDRRSLRLAAGSAATLVAAGASAVVTLAVAAGLGLHQQPGSLGLADLRYVGHTLHLLGLDAGVALGGFFPAEGGSVPSWVEAGVGLLVAAAVAGGLVLAWRRLAAPAPGRGDRARSAHVVFWALVAAADVAAFLGTDAAVDFTALRYLTPLWLAVAATLPLVAGRRLGRRLLVAAATAALAGAGMAAIVTYPLPPRPADLPLVHRLEKLQVTRVYADYWDANILTWASKGRVEVRPVAVCSSAGTLCPMLQNAVTDWFSPTSGAVAVVVDPRYPLAQPSPRIYGEPQRTLHVGADTVLVYAQGLRLADVRSG